MKQEVNNHSVILTPYKIIEYSLAKYGLCRHGKGLAQNVVSLYLDLQKHFRYDFEY